MHAPCHHQVLRAAHDRLRREVHRLLRRAALAVYRGARHVFGQPSDHPRRARNVAGQRAYGVDAAVDHIIHRTRVDTRAFHQRAQRMGAEVCRVNACKRAFLLADRRADGIDDIGLGSWARHLVSRSAPRPRPPDAVRLHARCAPPVRRSWASRPAHQLPCRWP